MKDDNILGNANDISKEVDSILGEEEASTVEDKNHLDTESDDLDKILGEDEGTDGNNKDNENIKVGASIIVVGMMTTVCLILLIVFAFKDKHPEEEILPPSPGFELTEDISYVVDTLKEAVDNLYKNNAYITMHLSSSDDNNVVYFLYNENKECYVESGFSNNIAVFRNNNTAIELTSPVQVREDLHILALIERMIHLVEKGYATVEVENLESDSGKTNRGYNLTSLGKHNTRMLYSNISTEYADDMMEGLYGDRYVKENYITEDFVDKDDLDAFNLQVVVGENDEFGASASIDIDGFTHLLWWFDGYMELSGFELDKAWYEEDNNLATWVNMAEKLQADLSDNIQEYLDNNLTDAEVAALEDEAESNELTILDFKRPEGELTDEESAWWDYIEKIHNKIVNGEEVTEQEKSDYYAMPPSGEMELE